MLTINKVSRYDVALAAIEGARGVNKDVAIMAPELVKDLEKRINDHASYIEEHGKGEDPALACFVFLVTDITELTKTQTQMACTPRRTFVNQVVAVGSWLLSAS